MVNTKMFRHPKYYKELRKRNQSFLLCKEECTTGKLWNKSDQAISEEATDVFDTSVRPGPGLKPQASSKTTLSKLIRKLNKENAPPGGW